MDPVNPTSSEPLISPLNHVVGVFDSRPAAQATVTALASEGFADAVDLYCGSGGAEQIDFSGEDHGAMAQLSRTLNRLTVEGRHMDEYERELNAGHCVVMVHTHTEPCQESAVEIMKSHGGRFINHYGPFVIKELKP